MQSPLLSFRQRPFLLLLGFSFFLLTAIVGQNLAWPNPLFEVFRAIPHHDKLGHFLLMGGLNFSLLLFLLPKWNSKITMRIALASLLVAAVVGAEELSQALVSSRTCSWLDYGASLLGILAAAFLVLPKEKIRPPN